MPRNIVQDVIPRRSRGSVRETPPRESKIFKEITSRTGSDTSEETVQEIRFVRKEGAADWRESPRSNPARLVLWLIGSVSAMVLLILLGNTFSTATLTVTPKSQKISINLGLVAKQKVASDELGYIPFTLTRDKEETIVADGEKAVESRASGRIIVYNNYSTSSQRLVKNTRFETPDGLIYKIADSVTVPGRHSIAGKSMPGSIEVLAYAETVGDEYNIGLTDFTLPGFKSNPERFNSFYGRSKTPMTGGKIGTEKVVSDEKMLQARARLEGALVQELLAETKKQVPADSIFYDTAYRIEFEPTLSGTSATGNNVTLRESARFTAFFVKQKGLADAIARNSLDNFDGTAVTVPDMQNLVMNLKTNPKYNATSIGPVEFNLKGDATLVWEFDQVKLKSDLAGKNKSELSGIISKYPAVVKADVTIRPFWKSSFPTASKITVLTP